MATLEGKKIVVVGGSSGIGYGVAKTSLLSLASHVIIGSSSQQKVEAAVSRLKADLANKNVPGTVTGEVIDAKSSDSVKSFFNKVGEIDHLVWTSGDTAQGWTFPGLDIDQNKNVFDVRFWGPALAAQSAKIRTGGSITLTIGGALIKPIKGWSVIAGILGAADALTRGLAVDLAPIRVNVICPGLVDTEMWDTYPSEMKDKIFEEQKKKLLVGHVADGDEIAEAYLFVMKCNYITGQRIEVDGGGLLSSS